MGPNDEHAAGPSRCDEETGAKLLNGKDFSVTDDGTTDLWGNPSSKKKSGGWMACSFILGNECAERLAFYGINTNLVTYLIREYHQGNAMAAKNVTVWSGTGYVTPVVGAFLADSFLGRYRTIATFSTLYLLGLVLLTLSASLPSLKPPACSDGYCKQASPAQLLFFYVALYMVAFGMGGIKPCISAFGADQFDNNDPAERKRKGHFFNWYYMAINVGGLAATTFLVFIQDNVGWTLGFGIPAACMGFSIVCFLIGSPLYRLQKPQGSPLMMVVKVLVAACRKWNLPLPEDKSLLYVHPDPDAEAMAYHTDDFRFLEKAAIYTDAENGKQQETWRLCSLLQVEEVKMLLRIVPIWATMIMFTTVYSQISTTFVEQGTRMDTTFLGFRISPASMATSEIVSVLIMVPIYDRVLIRLARDFTGHPQGFTLLQRMGVGLFIGVVSMLVASVVESRRLEVARVHGLVDDPIAEVPMSILWQLPQIVLLGVAETFTYIGQLEFFYEQAPDSMRSLGTAVALTSFGLGNYLNALLLVLVTRLSTSWIPDNLNAGHLNCYFNLIALLSMLNLCVYLWFARCFKYKEARQLLC